MRFLTALALALCVSALCFTVNAQFDDSFINLPSNAELMGDYEDHSPSLSMPISQLRLKDGYLGGDKHKKCHECVKGVAKHLLNSTWSFINETCKNATCPLQKKICKFIESHPEEETGFLIVKLRPGTYGYAYCSGKGKCPVHPNATLTDLDMSYNGASPDYFAMDDWKQIVNDALITEQIYIRSQQDKSLKTFDAMVESVAEYADEKLDKLQRTVAKFGREGDDESKGDKKCHKCVRKGVKCVMKIAVGAVKRKCKDTKCPHVKKACEWIKKHKQLFRGMLYGHILPYKFASGYCFGNRQCKCKKMSASAALAEKWGKKEDDDEDDF